MQFFKWCLLLTIPFCSLACSENSALAPVEGKVLVKDQPAEGVLVTFHPKDPPDPVTATRPVGRTGADGTFTLSSGAKEGVAPGEYVVTFIWPKETRPRAPGTIVMGTPETRDDFDGAYVDALKSSFKVEVKAGPNKLQPFVLK